MVDRSDTAQPTAVPSVLCAPFALALAGCAALPIDPDTGDSIWSLIARAFRDDWLNGVVALSLLGMPFLFGAVAGLAILARGRIGTTLIKVPLVMLQGELFLAALLVWHERDGTAPGALAGFGLVTTLFLIRHAAWTRARGVHTSLAWLVRWGALLVAGFFAWLRLQLADIPHAPFFELTPICAALLAVSSRGPSTTAPN